MTAPRNTLLFVYGSLRRDGLHHAELAGARFVAMARSEPRYELVDLGEYPAIVEGGTCAVVGELYEVDAALLAALDAFEEAPQVYQRADVRLATPREVRAQSYFMLRERVTHAARIAGGDWLDRMR
jgi:gamma-glutamylaminecyclotransferase